MRAVTLLAIGSVRIVLGRQLAMNALLMLLTNLGVASGAVHVVGNGLAWANVGGIDL